MSLFWTESFAGFGRHNGPNDQTEGNLIAAALQSAGYLVYRAANTADFMFVTDDAVVPTRAGLRFRTSVTTTAASRSALGRELPVTLKPVIFGFSLFIPSDYNPTMGQTNAFFGAMLSPRGATDWWSTSSTPAREAFRVRPDLAITVNTAAPQSEIKAQVGKINYFEVRLDGSNVSVWLNDALVSQSTTGEQAGIVAFVHGIATGNVPQNWQFGNFYILVADDQEPNVRLGPSTRVIGRRPDSDIQAQFSRPQSAASNAAVAGQDLLAVPAATLQSTTVGNTDIYTIAADADTAAASLVHAVAVKTVGANLEASPHSMEPFLRSDGEEAADDVGTYFEKLPNFSVKNFMAIAERGTGEIVIGGSGNALWYSNNDGDTWNVIREDESTTVVNDGVFGDGPGVFVKSNGQVDYLEKGSSIDQWQTAASGVANLAAVETVAATGGAADFDRLPDPPGVTGSANGQAFSPDGVHLAIAHSGEPYISVYKRQGDTFIKLPDPSGDLPTGNGQAVRFSPDGTHLVVAHSTAPFVTIYKRAGDSFTKLPEPTGAQPTGNGRGVSFSPDGVYLAVSHEASPFIAIYKRSGDSFARLPGPSGGLPTGNGLAVSFSADGGHLAVSHSATPFITIYKRTGDAFAKLPGPSELPTGTGNGTTFSPDGLLLVVAHASSPFITVYQRAGDTFAKLPNPAILPASVGRALSFTQDGGYLAVAHSSGTLVTIYRNEGGVLTKVPDPAALPAGSNGLAVAFGPSGDRLAFGINVTPFAAVLAIRRNAVFLAVGSSTSRKITILSGGASFEAATLPALSYSDIEFNGNTGIAAISNNSNLVRSTNGGATWTNATMSGMTGGNTRRIAYGNGVWVQVNSGGIWRSTDDGLTWVNAGPAMPGRILLDVIHANGMFIAVGYGASFSGAMANVDNGALIVTSVDGLNWKVYPRLLLGGSVYLRRVHVTASGRIIVIGDNGTVMVSRPMAADKQLPAMSGYRMLYNSAARDPATGLPWEPEAAAAAEFGMRVTS